MRQVVGLHASREVLQVRPKSVVRAILKNDFKSSKDLVDIELRLRSFKIKIDLQAPAFLDKICSGHQGLCLEVSDSPGLDWTYLKKTETSCVVALDGLEDPHNLGAILRTSWLLGVDGIFIPGTRQVQLTPTVSKIACGGAEHVPIQVESNLVTPLKDLRDAGFWVFGTSDRGSKSLWDLEVPAKVVWVFGAEDIGVRSSVRGACDELVTIPQIKLGPSYNASVAAAIVLAETRRQWLKS